MVRSTASCATALLAALPAALAATTVTKVPAAAWAPVNKVASGSPLTMSLLLSMQNIDSLESQLLALSTPGSPDYGKYLNNEQVAAQYGPSADSVEAVKSWLSGAGIDKVNVDGFFVDFSADVDTVNSLLKANYQHFAYNGQTKVRTTSYTLPDAVESHIALVDPGVYFGTNKAFRATPTVAEEKAPVAVRQAASSVSVAASCQTSITPACLKQLYNIGNYTASPGCGSKLGFGSFLNQSALYADQAQFEKLNGIPPQNFTTVLIAGGVDDQNPADGNYGEANLDAQNQVGIAHPLPITQYITGGSP
jgi:tripeptidyl-peptidase I